MKRAKMVTNEVRSRMMASIRGRNTTPELQVRKLLHRLGFRFRLQLHSRDLPGKPDVVLPKHNLAIFIHGCFWHKHEKCRFAVMPKTNSAFWSEKLNGNVRRDQAAIEQLHKLGWRTLIIWECALKSKGQLEKLPKRLARFIPSKQRRAQIPMKPRERLTRAPSLHS
jgi:DNA mismatch endonuclease (patch repair protein)